MTDLWACQVPSVQSWCHVTPPAACQKLIVLIGERQSCNKALRGDPPTQMKALRFVLCQGLAGNRRVRWPAGQEGRTTALYPVCVLRGKRKGHKNWKMLPVGLPTPQKLKNENGIIEAYNYIRIYPWISLHKTLYIKLNKCFNGSVFCTLNIHFYWHHFSRG